MEDAFSRGVGKAKADREETADANRARKEHAAKQYTKARLLIEKWRVAADTYQYENRHPNFFVSVEDEILYMGNDAYSISDVIKVEFLHGKLEMSGFVRQGEKMTADIEDEKEVDAMEERLGIEAHRLNEHHG